MTPIPLTEVTLAINTVWVVMAGCLVFLMHLGFTLLEAGFTRAKNAANICAKNMANIAIGMLAFWAVGFALMFGDGNWFAGHSGWLLSVSNPPDVFSSLDWAGLPIASTWFFQVVFAATAATIVSGAMAERTKFAGYLVYVVALTAFIYPVVGHWVWGGGWLADLGFIDFAGSTVVHTVGGTAAFVGAIAVGPRYGRYAKHRILAAAMGGLWNDLLRKGVIVDATRRILPGHSMPLAIGGVIILWFGWFGFNAGSTLQAVGADFASIIVTTNLAAAAGVIGAMGASWISARKPNVGMLGNGALGGLVAITAGCAFVDSWAAAVIGLIAGITVVFAVAGISRLGVDDPVGAVAVHGICGVLGTLAVGLFAIDNGVFYGHGFSQLGIQALGVIVTVAWVASTCLVVFYAIKFTMGLRVPLAHEIEGLDVSEHGASQ
jgi:Amt family ammonium transporter